MQKQTTSAAVTLNMDNNSKRSQEIAISSMICKLCKEQGGSIHDAKRFLAYIKSFRFASYFNHALKSGDSEVQALVFALAKCQDDTISKVERNTANLNYLSKSTFQAIRTNAPTPVTFSKAIV